MNARNQDRRATLAKVAHTRPLDRHIDYRH